MFDTSGFEVRQQRLNWPDPPRSGANESRLHAKYQVGVDIHPTQLDFRIVMRLGFRIEQPIADQERHSIAVVLFV